MGFSSASSAKATLSKVMYSALLKSFRSNELFPTCLTPVSRIAGLVFTAVSILFVLLRLIHT
jgi:hypothetical protein